MKLNLFFPLATVTAVAASVLSVSTGAQAAILGPGSIDLVGVGPLYYTQNAIDFTATPNGAPTPGTPGATNLVSSTGSFLTAAPPIVSPVKIFDVFSPTAFVNDVTYKVPATQLLDFGNGTGFYETTFTRTINTGTNSVIVNLGGYFLNGTDQTLSNLAVITGQQTVPIGNTAILPSLAALTANNSGKTSYSMTLTILTPVVTAKVPESSTLVGTLFFGLMGAGAVVRSLRTSRI